MSAAPSSWTLPAAAPVPKRARRGSAWRPRGVDPLAEVQLSLGLGAPAPGPVAPAPKPPAARAVPPAAKPSLVRQLAMGLGIFAGILAASVPLVFISEGLALAVAVALGAVLVALLARRLLVAPLIAALLAVLGAFAAAHSVHLANTEPAVPIRLAELAPASGLWAGGAPPATAVVMQVEARFGSERVPLSGWVFPAALFTLWAAGFGTIRANQIIIRWLLRKFGPRAHNPLS